MHAHYLPFQDLSTFLLKGACNAYRSLNMCTWQHVSNTDPFNALTKF